MEKFINIEAFSDIKVKMKFFKLYSIILIALISKVDCTYGQSDYDFLFEDGENYKEDRFSNSIGSPLLFDPWVIGMVYSNTGQVYYPMLVNYNVQEKKWEARNAKKLIALDPTYFWCVVLRVGDNPFTHSTTGDSLLFIRGLLSGDENEFVQVLYNGQNIKLLKSFLVGSTKQNNSDNVGFTLTRYIHRSQYFIISDTKQEKIKLTIEDVANAFGKKRKEIKNYFITNNLSPKGEKEWIEALAIIEKEYF